MTASTPGQVLSTILKHDTKVTSYKIALLRAINDTALAFPEQPGHGQDVAVPLRMLAERWAAYYWPFVSPQNPVLQGPRPGGPAGGKNDMAFRQGLTAFRQSWEALHPGLTQPSDGHLAVQEMRLPRRRKLCPAPVQGAYETALSQIGETLKMPIRYAGPGGSEWAVFPKPRRASELPGPVRLLPGAGAHEVSLLVAGPLWQGFLELSLWLEALCVHEWALFTERVEQAGGGKIDRGTAFAWLTARPAQRKALGWERDQVNALLAAGAMVACPWTGKVIAAGVAYDLDHLVPLSVYPVNELWNLVPSDPRFNEHTKKGRMPGPGRFAAAGPRLAAAYRCYLGREPLAQALREDAALRFAGLPADEQALPAALAAAVTDLMGKVAEMRNVGRF
jgi:hypothetical protein